MRKSKNPACAEVTRSIELTFIFEKPKLVACPQCGASVAWHPANRYRPFCSQRCKTIDLGAWATESYRVPVTHDSDTPDDEMTGGPSQP